MFKLIISTTLSAIILTPAAMANDAENAFRACMNDSLTKEEAIKRNDWALNCGYISIRDYDFNLYDDSGELRTRIKYPTYSRSFDLSNPDDVFKAPTDERASCELLDYTEKFICSSM